MVCRYSSSLEVGLSKDRSTARASYRSLVAGAIGVNGIKDEGDPKGVELLFFYTIYRFIRLRWSNFKAVS